MKITAHVKNASASHETSVCTAGRARSLSVPAKDLGAGSDVSGGEFLMLALATCYCNDIYREAQRLGIGVNEVEVEASAEFDGIGLAAKCIQYTARLTSDASDEEIEQLLRETDAVAEIHNTLRAGVAVTRVSWRGQA